MEVRFESKKNEFKQELYKVLDPRLEWKLNVEIFGECYEDIGGGFCEKWLRDSHIELFEFKKNYLNYCWEFYKYPNVNIQKGLMRGAGLEDVVNLAKYKLAFPPKIILPKEQVDIHIKDMETLENDLNIVINKYLNPLFI